MSSVEMTDCVLHMYFTVLMYWWIQTESIHKYSVSLSEPKSFGGCSGPDLFRSASVSRLTSSTALQCSTPHAVGPVQPALLQTAESGWIMNAGRVAWMWGAGSSGFFNEELCLRGSSNLPQGRRRGGPKTKEEEEPPQIGGKDVNFCINWREDLQ